MEHQVFQLFLFFLSLRPAQKKIISHSISHEENRNCFARPLLLISYAIEFVT